MAAPDYPMRRTCPLDPPPDLYGLQRETPVCRVALWDGSEPWLVTRHEDVRTVLTDPRLSVQTDRPGFPRFSAGAPSSMGGRPTFISLDPPEHDVIRKMLAGSFTPRRMEVLRPDLERIADGLLDAMVVHGPPADLVPTFALPLPSLVICRLLGVPYEDHDRFQGWSRTFVDTTRDYDTIADAGRRLTDYLDQLVSVKEQSPGDDLLSQLIEEQVRPGALDKDSLVDIARLMLTAGHETTANAIALGVVTLLRHPDQLRELRGDPALLRGAVEELLRYLTINHLGRRRVAIGDLVVGEQEIHAGDGVIAAADIPNRDDSVFPHPDDFDVHRDARQHVAFGFGIHQ
ncbi:MAG TPA: cytochrome P450, partial [Acidimicrobiales bacterium]|nr:cytochrome P450 [Acidimicrobiales bacterium]